MMAMKANKVEAHSRECVPRFSYSGMAYMALIWKGGTR